ncbi:MAG: porin [Bacteroidetes bacterium]|jgi:hypothetical protein|nr:porin [Bacteroidota bacterium]
MKRFSVIFLLFISLYYPVSAQTDSALKISGYADAYYAYNFPEPRSRNISYAYNHNRHNEFNVNNVIISLKYTREKVRGTVALHAGTYVNRNYATEPGSLKYINEANVGIRLTKKIWLDAGIMPSHIGLESAVSKDCWTLTRSLNAENSPYYESGAKLSFEPNKKWTIAAFILNGWQNITENNSNKAFGTQIQFKPNEKTLLNYSTFAGEARNFPDGSYLMRHFHDLYFTYLISEKVSIASVLDLGFQEKSLTDKRFVGWYAPSLLIRYKFHPRFSSCFRAEYFEDKENVIGVNAAGFSLNFDYHPTENAMLRIEGRTFPEGDNKGNLHEKSFLNSTLTVSLAISF